MQLPHLRHCQGSGHCAAGECAVIVVCLSRWGYVIERQASVVNLTDFEDIRLLIEPELKRMAQDLDWQLPDAARARRLSDAPLAPGGGVALRLVRDLIKGLAGIVTHARCDDVTRICVSLPPAKGRSDA